ncbi:hypothetical protein LEN26_002441, partial [Aphanomyces euteiches]
MVDRKLVVMFVRLWVKVRRRDLLMKYMFYHQRAFMCKIPKRVSVLTGAAWIIDMLEGNEEAFVENFRMPRSIFAALCHEQVGIFLYFAGQHASSAQLQQRFQHSAETITRHLRHVVKCINRLATTYIQIPSNDSPVPKQILRNPKFYPFFEKCRMAVDGTHIPVWVPEAMVAPFQGRKGITMNVLAACDFDLKFTYILAGWEGSAGDGKVYADALTKGYELPLDLFDVMDAGFALTTKALTPYRSTRYHLKEFARGQLAPLNKEELFNLRHAMLRNVIERIFGILKRRFPVHSHAVQYDYQFQVDM